MRFVTYVKELSLSELQAMAERRLPDAVTDADFLQTLAAHRCILMPRWVVRTGGSGELARVARVRYDDGGQLDKAGILVAMAQEFRRAKKQGGSGVGFGPRFSGE